jgi:hypothetical protein
MGIPSVVPVAIPTGLAISQLPFDSLRDKGRPTFLASYPLHDRSILGPTHASVPNLCELYDPRSFGRGQTIYDPWRYVPVLARKPGVNAASNLRNVPK